MELKSITIPQTIEDIPLLRTTLKIMKFWSFLITHTWRRYISITPYVIINVTEFFELILSDESVDAAVVRKIYLTVLFFNCSVRAISLCLQQFNYEKFMEELRVLYVELVASIAQSQRFMQIKTIPYMVNYTTYRELLFLKQDFKEGFINEMLLKMNEKAIRFTNINLTMGAIGTLCFLIYPTFAAERVLPFEMFIPGIDKYSSPYYEILFLLQVLMTPSGMCMYIPYTSLVVAYILFATLMARVLQHKLHDLNEVPKDQVYTELIWCIKYHLKFINYVRFMNKLGTYMHLLEFLLFGAMICVMLFLIIIVETLGQQIIIIMYLSIIFGQSVVIYYCANELYYQSLTIAEAVYDCNWFEFNVENRKNLQLLLQRAQKPCSVLIGNIYPMNLEMLQSLVNATYTYFTLLKRVYN